MSGLPFGVRLALVWWYLIHRHFCGSNLALVRANLRTWVLDRIPAEQHSQLFKSAFVRRCISTRACQICSDRFEAQQDLLPLKFDVAYIRSVRGDDDVVATVSDAIAVDDVQCCPTCYFESMGKVSGVEIRHIGSDNVPGNGQIVFSFICKNGSRPPASLNRVPTRIQRMIARKLMKLPSTREVQHLLDRI